MGASGYRPTGAVAVLSSAGCHRENPGLYQIIADFGVVDPTVSAADEAQRNNDRPETKAWAAQLRKLVTGEPEYHHFDELYRTDF